MKITVTAELPYDNEIQFHDVCKGIAAKFEELGEKAISDGEHHQFAGTRHEIVAQNDDGLTVGEIIIGR